jgi:hypothetical protein
VSRADTIPDVRPRDASADVRSRDARNDARARDADDCRCLCGSLIARRVTGGVELKCRRCKRCLVVALEPETGVVAIEARS